MTTLLFSHPSAADHDTGHGHPERADRIRAVLKALDAPEFTGLIRREPPRADQGDLARVHDARYVEALLEAVPQQGYVRLDADTVMSPASGEAALRAAGALTAAVDAVMAGDATSAFCAVRPPGHHAEPRRGMGFCLFNSIAIGALHARAAHGVERIAIVDFDVHHGNGTQAVFESDPAVLFASTHEYPLYPGTGAADERGAGNIYNVPLAPMSGSAEFRAGIERVVLPALEEFEPELMLVSAGFDAHARDPLATLRLDEEDFAWVTRRLVDIAGEHCEGRIVSTLEGGYDLQALAASVGVHVRELLRAGGPAAAATNPG
jgi:acetoin utilization deacetylase AcuC-like enzyme